MHLSTISSATIRSLAWIGLAGYLAYLVAGGTSATFAAVDLQRIHDRQLDELDSMLRSLEVVQVPNDPIGQPLVPEELVARRSDDRPAVSLW
jgi:hypothetical protein